MENNNNQIINQSNFYAMNRKFRTVVAVVLLLGMDFLTGCCKQTPIPPTSEGTNSANAICVKFTDKWKTSGNGCEHNMQVKLLCVSDADTSRLEVDGTCIKEFYGTNEVNVTKHVENGSHRILCYTLGTMDTVVNVTFKQENGSVNSWNSNINIHL